MNRPLLLLLTLAGALHSGCGAADDGTQPASAAVSWDAGRLKRSGIDPSMLQLLERNNRFPAGDNLVDISLNGQMVGAFRVRFGPQGALCFTPKLFQQLGVKEVRPDGPAGEESAACHDWADRDPDVSIRYRPYRLTVSLVVPQYRLQQEDPALQGEEGGGAGMLNYEFYTSLARARGWQERYSWLNTENGINVNNWLVRSRQQFQKMDGKVGGEISSLWAQRYLQPLNKLLQAGVVNVSNTPFALGVINGVQLMPDNGLNPEKGSGVTVNGFSATAQARVEIRQYGMEVFRTLVPAGAFTLDNIPVKNRNADLEVTVTETDGRVQQFSVPASGFGRTLTSSAQGYSLAIGKMRNSGGGEQPLLATLSQQWQPAGWLDLQSGMLLSRQYHSLALAASSAPLPALTVMSQLVAVNDSYRRQVSRQLRLNTRYQFSDTFSASVGLTKSSSGFLTPAEATDRQRTIKKEGTTQYSLMLAWAPPKLGRFTYSHAVSQRSHDGKPSRFHTLGWSKRVASTLVTVHASHGSDGLSNDRQLSLNLSFPLGEQRQNSYYRRSNDSERIGLESSGELSDNSNYQLSTERDLTGRASSVYGALNTNLHYTWMNATAGYDSAGQQNYSLGLNGGMALHEGGLTFTASRIGDTFGVVELNEKLAGVEIVSPGGTSWTDWRGRALVPSMTPWQRSSIDVNTEKLPKHIDISNGHRDATLARGTVKKFRYAMLTSNRLLFNLTLANGKPLPRGSRVWDRKNNYITSAIDDGVVWLSNAPEQVHLFAETGSGEQRCEFHYDSKNSRSEKQLYEKVIAQCL
ncbi:hypothetical protein WB66_02830 [bacteria symbiont BFo1 of Frankliniella occidentalis]|nr:hypothetical protein WB66_02830 [bacteria symbiont BFo1 of Frankliniella occidentalis]KYP88395.1 hypothetical protein WB91_17715 [bacteria symbiont BFo1 of Frankliniella occidentalis]